METDQKRIQLQLDKFYEIISGKAGEERDWNNFRNLFFSNAKLTPSIFSDDNKCASVSYDVETYIEKLKDYLQANDFFEKGVIHKIDFFCNIAQVNSSYFAKKMPHEKELLKSGKNFIQFLHDGNGWKIVSMLWEDE